MKKSQTLVSIIMNCHNGEKYLSKSIQSIILQSYKNWELVFWDNKSSDNSKKILKSFKDKRIKYFYSNKFNTLYKSRNLAIEKTKGKFVCFLDTDDKWNKNKIEKQINLMKKKNYDLIFTNYYVKNEVKNTLELKKNGNLFINGFTQELLNNYNLGILTVMMKKKIFKQCKFEKKFQIIGDFDFFIKTSLYFKFHYMNTPLATYRFYGENLHARKIHLYYKEMKYWIKKNEFTLFRNFDLANLKKYLLKLRFKTFFNYFLTKIYFTGV
jgi:glycosyltransferase involved in cell wall biosynthesis